MTDRLLPCPFCGFKMDSETYNFGTKVRYFHHANGCVLGRKFVFEDEVEAWNTRSVDCKPDAIADAAASAVMKFRRKVNGRYYPGYHEDMRDAVREAVFKAFGKVPNMLTYRKTLGGFAQVVFTDHNGTECIIQRSSLAGLDALWLGAKELKVKRLPGDQTGWREVNFGELFPGQPVIGNERMHLTREQVSLILPVLQHFVDTGELPE